MVKSKKTYKRLKPEWADKVSKYLNRSLGYTLLIDLAFTILMFVLYGLGLRKALDYFTIPGRIIFGVFFIVWCVYLVVMPFVIVYQIYNQFRKRKSCWLTINLIVYACLVLLSTCAIHNEISERECLKECLARGTDESSCELSICDSIILW